jgi:hypothetical protein
VRENTKTWRGWYVNLTRTTRRHAGPPVQRAWIGEVEEPWRAGRGVLFRILPTVAVNVGRWAPTTPTEPREDVASSEDVKEWHGSLRQLQT